MNLLDLFRRRPKAARSDPAPAAPVESRPTPAPTPRPPFALCSFGLSDPGRVRPTNEDRFVVVELARTMYVRHTNMPQPTPQYSSHRGHVLLVADGMGGHEAGEVASALTVETIEEFLLNTLRRFTNLRSTEESNALKELHEALRQADARLFAEVGRHPEWKGMGTTLTLAFAVNWTLFVAHAGDSRCYLFSTGTLHQLTRDHTFTAELIRQGALSASSLAQHPYRHVVTNVLGGKDPGVDVDLHRLDLHPGDQVLLCSDGLTDVVSDERIAAALREEPDPQRACERLVAEANAGGGPDNITVLVAHVEEPGDPVPTPG